METPLNELIKTFSPSIVMDQEDAAKCDLILDILDKLDLSRAETAMERLRILKALSDTLMIGYDNFLELENVEYGSVADSEIFDVVMNRDDVRKALKFLDRPSNEPSEA